MTPQRRFFLQKWGTILGCFLSLLPNGITWLWGNLSVYVYSYFHAKDSGNSNKVQTPWPMSVYISTWNVAMLGFILLEKKLGRRTTIAIGMTSYIAGVITSHFVLDSSIDLLNLTVGALCGIGTGIMHTMVTQRVLEWADASEVGLISSGVIGAYSLGSIIINQFVTLYVNPHNIKPNLVVGPTVLFGQKDILSRVPNVFLFNGAGTAVLHIIGFCLMRTRPNENSQKMTSDDDTENTLSKQLCDEQKPLLDEDLKLDTFSKQSDYDTCKSSTHEKINGSGSMNCTDSQKRKFNRIEKHRSLSNTRRLAKDIIYDKKENFNSSSPDCRAVSTEKSEGEYSPREMLKETSFYSLWFALLFAETSYMVFLNYYKMFGQVWIKDDHFLTDLANVSACVGFGAAFLWGFIIDRIGVKATNVGFFCAVCLVSTFYYFTPQINVWLYFFSTLVFSSLCSGVVTNFTVASFKCFGKKSFTANLAIIFTASVISNLAAPPLIQLTLSNSGWFSLFIGVAAVNFISLILIVCLLKEC